MKRIIDDEKRLFGITLKVDFQPIWQLATIGNKIHPLNIPLQAKKLGKN